MKTMMQAFLGSLDHWRELTKVTRCGNIHIKADDCPLCDLYWVGQCEGCPVRRKTRKTLCFGSPYDAAVVGRNKIEEMLEKGHRDETYLVVAHFRTAAIAELAWLESLFPIVEVAHRRLFIWSA